MWDFIIGFMKKYPKYKDLNMHIFGESYAGHYVPATAAKIVENVNAGKGNVNLKSIAIGNGLTAPGVQFREYLPYAEEHNLVDKGQAAIMAAVLPVCEALTYGCNHFNASGGSTNATIKWAVVKQSDNDDDDFYTTLLISIISTGINDACTHIFHFQIEVIIKPSLLLASSS